MLCWFCVHVLILSWFLLLRKPGETHNQNNAKAMRSKGSDATGSNGTLFPLNCSLKMDGDARGEIVINTNLEQFDRFVRWTLCTETKRTWNENKSRRCDRHNRLNIWKQSRDDSHRLPPGTLSFSKTAADICSSHQWMYRDVCSIVSSLVFKIWCSHYRAAKVKVNNNNSGGDDDDALSVGAIRCHVWRYRSQTTE